MTKISSSRMDMGGGRIDNALLKNYAETLVGGTGGTNTTATYAVDLSTGNAFYLVLNNTPVTLSFTNPSASGTECSFTLLLKQDTTGGRTVTWPASVKWPGGRAPVLSTAGGKVNIMAFSSPDNGTTWFGLPSGSEFTPGVGFPLFGMGNNTSGEIGDNTGLLRSSPVQVGNTSNWAQVSVGQGETFALDRTGAFFAWGSTGNYGQLPLNFPNSTVKSSPVQVGTLTTWTTVRAIKQGGAALRTDGTLWAWGINTAGQVGDNTGTNRSSPTQIGTLTNWASLGVGSPATNSFAIDTSGHLFTWGLGTSGQLGNSASASASSPVQIGTLTNWATVTSGLVHTLAVKTDGTLWATGTQNGNSSGVLGDNTLVAKNSPIQVGTLTNWAKVAASQYASHAVKTDGTLWGWGSNLRGEVGDSTITGRSSPTQVGTLTNWSNVAGGNLHVLGLKIDGTFWGWGNGSGGQLGLAVPPNTSSPVQVGAQNNWASTSAGVSHAAAVKTDGTLWVWGLNSYGQLGINSSLLSTSSPVQVGTLTNWAKVVSGGLNTFALDTTNRLWGWGHNTSGQVGDSSLVGRSSPVQIGTLTNWTVISISSSNNNTSAAIDTSGRLFTWGVGANGARGSNTAVNASSPVQVGTLTNWTTISLGSYTGFAVKTDGSFWIWGVPTLGVLGNSTVTPNISSPVQLGTLTNWSKVFANFGQQRAIMTDGSLWSWGAASNTTVGNNSALLGLSSPVQVGTLTNWSSVGMGQYHSLASKTDGTMWGWGVQATGGSIGDNATLNRSSPVQVGTFTNWPLKLGNMPKQASVIAKQDNTLWGWGYRGIGHTGDNFVSFQISPTQIGTLTSWTGIAGGSVSLGLQQE